MTNRRTITVQEVADALGISLSSCYDAIRRDEIPVVRLGRRILIPRARFDEWLGDTSNQAREAAGRILRSTD